MCRLLGYSSTTPTTFGDAVGKNFDQFVSLANDHCDGWGIATTDNHKAELYKEPVAATKSEHFKEKLEKHKSNAALLHLRWATEGMPVNENNTHPFTYQDITFIHNGSITPPTALDPLIDRKYLSLAKGTTDSERYFLYLLTQIEKHGFIDG
ncbi:MAG: class II glutamine amidotransferase, partial [Actinobacteria bacterium]|nr:class II glutamine amidotransferase [Actinomycetota bacterium]